MEAAGGLALGAIGGAVIANALGTSRRSRGILEMILGVTDWAIFTDDDDDHQGGGGGYGILPPQQYPPMGARQAVVIKRTLKKHGNSMRKPTRKRTARTDVPCSLKRILRNCDLYSRNLFEHSFEFFIQTE
jgi:hypothetical protein